MFQNVVTQSSVEKIFALRIASNPVLLRGQDDAAFTPNTAAPSCEPQEAQLHSMAYVSHDGCPNLQKAYL